MVSQFSVFLSVIIVARNQADSLQTTLTKLTRTVQAMVSDYEIIVIDNASTDATLSILKNCTQTTGLPNLQVFSLTSQSNYDAAVWVGVENCLGDFVVVVDPQNDDINLLPTLLETAVRGADVVFAYNEQKPQQSLAYSIFYSLFKTFYQWLSGIDLSKEAPQYRLMSRRLVNFLLQHPSSSPISYRHLPASSGFAKTTIAYKSTKKNSRKKYLRDSIERGVYLLISTSRAPMRLVTLLSLFGAITNLIYSMYVIGIMIWKSDVTPGWITLSLQQSGMFFLISLVLFILGEYIMHIVIPAEPLNYHIAHEFTSQVMERRLKLNVEITHSTQSKESLECTTPL